MTYPATPCLRRLTADHGWRGVVLVTVRVGSTWTDSMAIEGEDRAVAMRHRTRDSDLIVPSDSSTAVWRRDGRCADVLAELLELPEGRPQ